MEIPVYTSSLGSVAEMGQIWQPMRVLRYPRDPDYLLRPLDTAFCISPSRMACRTASPSEGEFDLASCVLLSSEDECAVSRFCRCP
jgi:hypothetical protein